MGMPHAQQDSEFNPYGWADQYRKFGWMGTIPLPLHEKHPPPKGYTGLHANYPTDERVKAWLTLGPKNIGIRLAEVDYTPPNSPYETATGYELLGIDVDDYGNKTGFKQLLELEKEYGKLPSTVTSSSRWESSPDSGVRLFFVPAGLHFLGKAASAIDIIQKAHRYMVVWPSANPDADGARYRWRSPNGAFYVERREAGANDVPVAVPPLSDIAILPEAWLDFLSCNRMVAPDEEEVSKLGGDELLSWASDTFNDSAGEMCRVMSAAVNKKIDEISEESAGSHPLMLAAHWQILRLAAEGHGGWIDAMKNFNNAWVKSAIKKRGGGSPEGLVAEIQRSVMGSLSKIEPSLNGYIAEDECAIGTNVTALHDVDNWGAKIDGEAGPDLDSDDLGPVVRYMNKRTDHSPGEYDQNDHGNARHFIDVFDDNISFVDSRRSWVLWDGKSWHRDTDEKLATRAFSVVEKRQKHFAAALPRGDKSAISKAEAWRKWGLKSGNATQIRNALILARTLYTEDDQPVALSGKEFDANPKLLGCENGILVLDRDPYLRPAKKEDYVTYNTRTPYIPWDTNLAHESGVLEGYKLWGDYLDTFLPDLKLRHFIQKVMGHLLIGENPEKLLIFVYGPHDTGKSTMLGGISSALGDYYGTIDINLFNNQKLNPNLIRAVPLRVTGMSEIDAGRMDASTIKRLTGNDRVTAEAKFSNEIFEGRPQFTTLIACNNEPSIRNVDEALQERILVLPFEYQIQSDRRQYGRQADIEKLSGIAVLSWLVEGWRMYCKEGLKRATWPIEVKRLCGSVVGHLNATQAFIAECIDKTSKEAMEARQQAFHKAALRKRTMPSAADWDMEWTPTTAMVYELYSRWCVTNGERQISLHELTRELGAGNPQVKNIEGSSQRCYVGFRLKTNEDAV